MQWSARGRSGDDESATVAQHHTALGWHFVGLGDYIEFSKNAWINLFAGASHQRYQESDWQVKKDGGQIDYIAGATITPRAVAKAVHNALRYFDENRVKLFEKKSVATKMNTGTK